MKQKKARVRSVAEAERTIVRFLRDLIAQGDKANDVWVHPGLYGWHSTTFRGKDVSVNGDGEVHVAKRGMPADVNKAIGKKLYRFLVEQAARQHVERQRRERRRPARELKRLARELAAAE
jgi:hypothetical protein